VPVTRGWSSHHWRARSLSLESGLVITGEQCSRHSRAVWSSLESNVLVTRERSGHHWRAMFSSLESGLVITGEPCARHWRAVGSSLESHVLVTGERSGHHSRAMCPSLESGLVITREPCARHSRSLSESVKPASRRPADRPRPGPGRWFAQEFFGLVQRMVIVTIPSSVSEANLLRKP